MTQASEPQAVLAPLTEAAIFLVLTVDSGADDVLRDLLGDVSGLRRSVGFRIPEGGLTCVVGLGSELWERLFGSPRLAGLHAVPGSRGERHAAVATPGNLLFDIRAHRFDLCFELAERLTNRLLGHARVLDEVHGFRSFDERDLLGFVDGTENPEGAAAVAAVTIGAEDPRFAGGGRRGGAKVSPRSRRLGCATCRGAGAGDRAHEAQRHRAAGRGQTCQLTCGVKTIVDKAGERRQIVRFDMPLGRVGTREFGTYFIGYAGRPDVIEQTLSNMFIGNPPGNSDRILEFSTAVTGNLFFVPTADFLDDPETATNAPGLEDRSPSDEQPLGIGALKGDQHGFGSTP